MNIWRPIKMKYLKYWMIIRPLFIGTVPCFEKNKMAASMAATKLVVDNGAYSIKIGFSNNETPR